MTTEIHGHDVLDLMLASGETYTTATLVAAIHARFGPAARFHTCSATGLTAAELVEFLAARGKFRGPAAGFTVAADRVCPH